MTDQTVHPAIPTLKRQLEAGAIERREFLRMASSIYGLPLY